ncbi:MAG TPA: hypothetical protein VFQ61_00850 [Polyangiaceae bacterium]|nr:hypothetical protein [Polyangiaceae bacterium]
MPNEVYEKAPLSRGADIAVGVGLAALFAGSAVYGFKGTSACRRAQPKSGSGPQPASTLPALH